MSAKKTKTPAGSDSGLLKQMGQGFDKLLNKLNKRPPAPLPAPGKDQNLGSATQLELCARLEKALSLEDGRPPWPEEILKFVLEYTGLSWAFLTEVINGDPRHFVFIAGLPFPRGLELRQPMSSGLAGYVHTKLQPLAITSIKDVDDLSFVFHPGEPLKKAASLYGWPLVYNGRLRGALLLVGKAGQVIDDAQLAFLDHLVVRLTSHYQTDKLTYWVMELNRLDSQSNLPHRTYFIERLGQFIEANKPDNTVLSILSVSGLGRFALAHGQKEAAKLLKGLSENLLENSRQEWELGHISYGLFALAVPQADAQALDAAILSFQKRLGDWPIPTRVGHSSFIFHQSRVVSPRDGLKPEMLVEVALSNLAAADS
ncbi:MAG: GAF domain-containing protein [Deltaproteobacteria bacterium]|nr:GAF domain-containing protein [Deltaproteobacteria bacterium]